MSAKTIRGFWPLRDLPVLVWLVATGIVSLVHPFVPAPRWLMIHLLLLGAVSHAILVWSRHFADALLHTRPGPNDRRVQSARLLLLNAGVFLVVGGVLGDVWSLVLAGATAVVGAVGWHAVALVLQMRRALPSRFGATVRYYVVAAALLPVGATLGTILARGLSDPLHGQMRLAHATTNLLGWMGLTIVGTLVTLWPTMLRTRMAAGTERAARWALPVLATSVVVAAGGALLGSRATVVVGLDGYIAGLGLVAVPFLRTAVAKRPSSYPTWSVLAGLAWLVGSLAAMVVGIALAPSWQVADQRVSWMTPFLAAGFGAQVLLGALSYLVPMALGGGPHAVRAANTVLDRGGALRIVLVNGGLLVAVLPVPSIVRVVATTLVLGGLAAFVPLLVMSIRASRKARSADAPVPAPSPTTAAAPGPVRRPASPHGERPTGQVTGLAATGLAALVLAVAVGVALDPASLGGTRTLAAASAGVVATGETRTVEVDAKDMRFTPATIEVPAGTHLVIELTNTDDADVHDLVLDSGVDSGRLAPGESATVDVGVVGRDVEGWCSVVGHRQMGMVLTIVATGLDTVQASGGSDGDGHADHTHGPGAGEHAATDPPSAAAGDPADEPNDAADDLDHMAVPDDGFVAHDAELPPLEEGRVHRRTLTVTEVEREVAPGVTQRLWTYNGAAPGPVLHGRVGDVFEITLVNDGTIGHSVDFHAGALAPDRPMRTIAPGESLVYRFTATRAGIWMYHCSTMPMSAHIANGMFGAVVIEPKDLPPVDRSYLLVQSELYLGPQGGVVDTEKVQAERPDAVVFNGYANQYDAQPLPARVGERVRVWVLDAGPNRPSSFHVVGGQFDTVYFEGAYLLRDGDGGSQTLALAAAQGGFVELAFPEAGRYPFVSHVMVDAERGAHGIFDVTR
ncbi:MAG TPA: multicopper oxidase domain-containing protein [Nocardioidaceae bacterium]|nr:multicopper oxidase domain-containing protein [Nocardioidaceae bacterium]